MGNTRQKGRVDSVCLEEVPWVTAEAPEVVTSLNSGPAQAKVAVEWGLPDPAPRTRKHL